MSQRLQFGSLLASLLLLLCSCDQLSQLTQDPGAESPIQSAEFGVLFGGQIQERDQVPFELDARKQQLGFRVQLKAPLQRAATLEWELSKPTKQGVRDLPVSRPEGRVTQLGSVTLPAGETRIDQTFRFEPGDPLGLWNVRVTLDDQLVLDRPFMVFDQRARRRAIKAAAIDAGL